MHARRTTYLQLAPLCLVLLLFVAAPLVFVVIVSFFRTTGFSTVPATETLPVCPESELGRNDGVPPPAIEV